MAVFFILAAIAAVWRIAVADGENILYVPGVLVLAAAAMLYRINDKQNS